ncbi:MAG: LytTR family DNA-binding domain-containing protein [Lachnospiraceae bacterium]|nr:LytTR family DNA-binding domain-containing protein [Lachnospiraceae bacterium]
MIDDEPLAGRLIASYIERTPDMELCGVFTSASDAIKCILDGSIDTVFLDIEMPQINGLEFAKLVPPTCSVVFTTAYEQYAVQGFKVDAVDYLLKPVSYNEFLDAVGRVRRKRGVAAAGTSDTVAAKREFMLVKSEYRLVQIRISDISIVEGLKDYVKIHVSGMPKPVLTLMSMRSVEQALPSDEFIRVHRSYIVNKKHISVIERNHIIIAEHAVPVSESYRQQFSEYIESLGLE